MRDQLEKRLSPRKSAAIRAELAFRGTRVDCIVRNISETGARLEVTSVGRIPNNLSLLVPGYQPQSCRVVWRALRELGVEFAA